MREHLEISGGLEADTLLEVASPQNNFYQYINHEWLETTEIPPSEPIWGTFNVLRHKTYERLHQIAEETLSDITAEKGSNVQLVRDFYSSAMDMERRNDLGSEPLEELRAKIGQISNASEAVAMMAELRLAGSGTFFRVGISEDDKKAGSYAMFLGQGGLGLPTREYYLKDDEASTEKQAKYRLYLTKLFTLAGRSEEDASAAADRTYELEYALAEASLPPAEARDVEKNYFKFTREEAAREFPGIDWDTYFATLGDSEIDNFVIQQPGFMKKVSDVLQADDFESIKDYLEVTLLNDFAGKLSQDFVDASFDFNGRVLSGTEEQKPLWKKSVEDFNFSVLSNAIGPLYCEQFFDQSAKSRVMEIVGDIVTASRKRIDNLDWMTDETKALTHQKLAKITYKMGFPDKWVDVSGLEIVPDNYAKNMMNVAGFNFSRKLARINEPYDHSEWHMPPTMVNACSDLKRELTFPAAILQSPFFDPSRDDAYNYGSIGMVIGHEEFHFVDDNGCKYDVDGNMNDWWSDTDRENFEALTHQFVEYFSSLKANGLKVNGQLTLGENIADVAGMAVAFDAFQVNLERNNSKSLIVDGLTPEQRFFIGYSKIWTTKIRQAAAERRILEDPHSPAEVRTNGVLAINPNFHEAFDVVPGNGMYVASADQPKLW